MSAFLRPRLAVCRPIKAIPRTLLGPTLTGRTLSTAPESAVAYLTTPSAKSKDKGLTFLALDRPEVSRLGLDRYSLKSRLAGDHSLAKRGAELTSMHCRPKTH